MKCSDDEDSGDDEVESENGVLTVKDSSDCRNIQQTSDGFVVESEMMIHKITVNGWMEKTYKFLGVFNCQMTPSDSKTAVAGINIGSEASVRE